MKNLIAFFSAVIIAVTVGPFLVNGQSAAVWIPSNNLVQLFNATYGVRIQSLGSTGNPCLTVSTTGVLSTTTCGSGGGSGTVTSVNMTVPTGLTVTGNPVTTAGTLALTLTSGYEIPLTASTTNWQTAFSWGNHSVAGYLTSIATTTVRGMLSATSPLSYNSGTGDFSLSTAGDWTGTFDGQQGTWYIDRGNHSGTQLASTISDFSSTARGLLSETITGITYTSGTGVFSLDASYTIPTSTLINNLNSFYTTPSTVIAAGDALTWSANTINFDGGAAPGGELGGTWASPTLDDSIAVTSWNLTTPTLTSFFGTPCTGNQFLQDISDTGAFTCATATGGGGGLSTTSPWTNGNLAYVTGLGTVGSVATTTLVAGSGVSFTGGTPIVIGSSPITIEATGGGGGGALSTTTDTIGSGGSQLVSYVTGDVMFGGSASTSAEFQFDDDGGQFIISSSSANATATIESTNSADAVRLGESTGGGGGVEFSFFNGSSTTLSPYGTQIGDLFQFLNFAKIIISSLTDVIQNFSTIGRDWSIGILADAHKNFVFYVGSTFTGNPAFVISASSTIAVGTSTYHGGPLLDGAYVPGIVNTGEWIEEFCTTPVGETVQIAADTARGCGRYYYAEDAAGVIDFTTQSSGTAPYFRIRAGTAGTAVAAGDGMGINWGIGLDGGDLQIFSPVMEWVWRRGLIQNSSSTFFIGGLTNAVGVSADFAAEPSEGFYVIATGTTPNFVFACNPSSGGTTYSNTGIASSTVGSGDESAFRQWRIEITGTVNTSQTATLYSRTATTSMMIVGTPCTINQAASTAIIAPTVSIGKSTAGTSPELHVQWIKFWYKSPL